LQAHSRPGDAPDDDVSARSTLLKIRGSLVIGLAGLSLVVSELIQRTVIVSAARLRPSKKHEVLAAWQQWMARLMLGIVSRVGGARYESIPRIPARPGVLVLMNHQSLMDIPMVVRAVRNTYPRIVTRARYARGKPLISHMVRLYQYPTVDPRSMTRTDLDRLQTVAAESPVPLVIFPEGTRTRDGALGRFRRTGLRLLLAARQWEVWVLVADGWWKAARLEDFVEHVSTVRGKIRAAGPFTSPGPDGDDEAFIRQMEEHMAGLLAELRGTPETQSPARDR
jgi:1-acyl-sn-glycerol-3-phosphate acyltransferase